MDIYIKVIYNVIIKGTKEKERSYQPGDTKNDHTLTNLKANNFNCRI